MYNPNDDDQDDEGLRGQVERRRQPFAPDPYRVVLPAHVDYAVRQRLAVEQYVAETRIEVGGEITRSIIRRAGRMEREIRNQAEDRAHYLLMAQVLAGFMGDAEQLRHEYMNPDDRPEYRR
jgi:DNA-binding transcriptional LysR family regulator